MIPLAASAAWLSPPQPSFWERLTDSQHRYRAYVDSIILEMATGDDVVLTGLAAAIVLRQVPFAVGRRGTTRS